MKLTVATTFPIFPPRGGGQARLFGLYSALARLGVEVEVVSLVAEGERGGARQLAPGLREVRVPATDAHTGAEYVLQRRAGVSVGDLVVALHHDLTPAFGEAIAESARAAAAVVASHPFTQPVIAAACSTPLIYEAHNVEVDLKAAMFAGGEEADWLTGAVREVEAACCASAQHVTVCAAADGIRLRELYDLDEERVVLVPNGADPDAMSFTDGAARRGHKAALGLGDTLHALFLGSWHEPNVIAVRAVLAAAELAPERRFLVLGSVGRAFAATSVPANVDLCGEVDDGFLRGALAFAGAALNPMSAGSGTNLKMLEYALAGVPLVSSTFGARGLGFEPGRHYLGADPDQLAAALDVLCDEDDAVTAARVEAARDHVRERFSWSVIAAAWRRHPAFASLLAGLPARA